MKAKFIVIGYGWRADFFYRIAKEIPEKFEICAGVLRTQERAAQMEEKWNVFATASLEEALKKEPDFAVLCVPRTIVKDYLCLLMDKGVPVLCETPPAQNVEELRELWQETKRRKGRIQAAEQYFLQPYYGAVAEVIKAGYLGEVSNVTLSAIHGYHAASIFRKLLGIGYENCTIAGRRFSFDVTATNSREGFDNSGRVIQADRDMAFMKFENGKTAFLDFSGEQYFSLIRTRRWNIQGVRGEINDNTVRFLTEKNLPVEQELKRVDVGVNNNKEWSHRGIMFLDKMVYENPYYPARLNDDEIAVASCLGAMKAYAETGKEFYPLREALQDTYLAFAMEQALDSGEAVSTARQPWALE
ncbi:MAG: Gfo/Idh/MocA family oxidoreductase [Clostridium sp.]|nr:Gfo/Idh/MocA family oxidoreductase [Clostridium sp.]